MVTAGERPGTGFYFCIQCGHRAYLEIGTDRLPPCTKCLGNQFNSKNACAANSKQLSTVLNQALSLDRAFYLLEEVFWIS